MANKKNNKRKFVAVGLGLIGIAGLSVASAATLNIETANEVAIGTDTFAACAESASVDYTYVADASTASGYAVNQVTVVITDGDCANADIEVSFDDHAATASGQLTGDTFTSALTGSTIDLGADLGDVTVIVG